MWNHHRLRYPLRSPPRRRSSLPPRRSNHDNPSADSCSASGSLRSTRSPRHCWSAGKEAEGRAVRHRVNPEYDSPPHPDPSTRGPETLHRNALLHTSPPTSRYPTNAGPERPLVKPATSSHQQQRRRARSWARCNQPEESMPWKQQKSYTALNSRDGHIMSTKLWGI